MKQYGTTQFALRTAQQRRNRTGYPEAGHTVAACVLGIDTELWLTAIHEAAHVVVAYLKGIRFRRVTVIPDYDLRFAGHVSLYKKEPLAHVVPWSDDWNAEAARQYWTGHVCAILSGWLAENLCTQRWRQQSRSNPNTDEYKAWKISDYFYLEPAPKRAQWINRLRFQTLELLRTPEVWAAVEAVAQALIKRKTLKSAEVQALVKRTRTPCPR